MENPFAAVIERCRRALEGADPQGGVEVVLNEAVRDPAVVRAVSTRTKFASLADLAIHRSPELTMLAGAMPPGFYAGPHNHNLWSVVGVCAGQEDNTYFKRDGEGLKQLGTASVVGPAVLANGKDVIHAIRNPLDEPLLALHAYGGDLFGVSRSNWDPKTFEEAVFDWRKVAGT